ncbi:MAG: sucrase ferredoxin [Chloroflexota bacterium]
MTNNGKIASTKAYCNVLALEKGLDPAGYAGVFDTAFALELPLPWPRAILLEPDKLPPELVQLIGVYLNMPEDERPSIRPLFIAPDEVYSKPGHRRFIYYTRPAGAFAAFDRHEYLMPEAEVGKLIWALQQEPETVAQFAPYRVDNGDVRDIMVCTHGSVDVACAKFGYPLYRHLRDELATDKLRVWRVNHFGGHVFAPTLMDMPRGDYWAFIDPEDGHRIIERNGDFVLLGKKYRGSAALPYGFAQAMERDILLREGWVWTTYQRQSIELAKDEGAPPGWAEIRITYQSEDGSVRGTYEGRVTIADHVETIGSTGDEKTHTYPQYRVTRLEKIE